MKRPICISAKIALYSPTRGPHVNSPSGISRGCMKINPVVIMWDGDDFEHFTFREETMRISYEDYWEGVTVENFEMDLYKANQNEEYYLLTRQFREKHWHYEDVEETLYTWTDRWEKTRTKEGSEKIGVRCIMEGYKEKEKMPSIIDDLNEPDKTALAKLEEKFSDNLSKDNLKYWQERNRLTENKFTLIHKFVSPKLQ